MGRGAYVWNNYIFVSKWMGLYLGGLKTRGGFNVGFYGMSIVKRLAEKRLLGVVNMVL